MTNEPKEDKGAAKAREEAINRQSAEEDATPNPGNLNYDSPAEADPAGEAHKQREQLSAIQPKKAKWFHDASHSATAERLAAQRARDEAEWPPEKAD